MDYGYIIYKKEGEIATITMNQPEKLNAWPFYGGIADEFMKALDEAEEDDDIKIVVINGAGPCFCSGHDLGEVGFAYGYGTGKRNQPQPHRPGQKIRLQVDRHEMYDQFGRLLYYPKVTLASVHSYCTGQGLILATMTDLVIASDDAVFGHPGMRLGFGGAAVSLPLILAIGWKRVRELYLTGRSIAAEEARQIGFVNFVVPRNELEEKTYNLAKAMCLQPADGLAIGKAAVLMQFDLLGMHGGFTQGFLTHTLYTNLRWKPDEFSWMKERRNQGVKSAMNQLHKMYSDLLPVPDAMVKRESK